MPNEAYEQYLRDEYANRIRAAFLADEGLMADVAESLAEFERGECIPWEDFKRAENARRNLAGE